MRTVHSYRPGQTLNIVQYKNLTRQTIGHTGKDVVGKLDFGNGGLAHSSHANSKSSDALFRERGVENSFARELFSETLTPDTASGLKHAEAQMMSSPLCTCNN
jgi:hypothetical protein